MMSEAVVEKSVNSSNIKYIKYYPTDQILVVEFQKGATYQYWSVPQDIINGLFAAESIGKYFHRNIKDKYYCEVFVDKNNGVK